MNRLFLLFYIFQLIGFVQCIFFTKGLKVLYIKGKDCDHATPYEQGLATVGGKTPF